MSRLTGSDALGLFEAYQTIYTPQEITEEQVWEEVECWVNNLIEEGYDLSDYTWEEMYDAYLNEERAPGVRPYRPGKPMSYSPSKPLSGERGDGSGYGDDTKFTQDTDARSFRPGTDVPKVKIFGRISKSIPRIGDHTNKTQSRVSTIVRKDPGAPNSQKLPPQKKKKPSREIVRKRKDTNESYDYYDLVLSYLLDEGYANSIESAEKIMVNMSEVWVEDIIENVMMAAKSPQSTTMGNQSAKTKVKTTAKPAPSMNDRIRTVSQTASKMFQQY
jgi:hypothetical protein